MKPCNPLTALSCALEWILANTPDDLCYMADLMPWNALQLDYKFQVCFDVQDNNYNVLERVRAKLNREELAQYRDKNVLDAEILLHYLELLEQIDGELKLIRERDSLLSAEQARFQIALDQHESLDGMRKRQFEKWTTMRDTLFTETHANQDGIMNRFPKPAYISNLDGQRGKTYLPVSINKTARWILAWMLMKHSHMSAETFAQHYMPDYESIGIGVLMPINAFAAWEPLFTVHRVGADFFKKYFWQIHPEYPDQVWVGKSEGCYLDTSNQATGYHMEETIRGQDLIALRRELSLVAWIQKMQGWGYDRDSIWPYFEPKEGFMSRVFSPTTVGYDEVDPTEQELEANALFREEFIPHVFDLLFSPKKSKVRKPSKKTS